MKSEGYLERLSIDIEDTAALFYQRKDAEAYEKLNPLFSDILSLMNLLQTEGKNEKQEEVIALINQGLMGAMEAMQNKDTILIADELVHVVRPLLEGLAG